MTGRADGRHLLNGEGLLPECGGFGARNAHAPADSAGRVASRSGAGRYGAGTIRIQGRGSSQPSG